jgi:SnoaL-like domain
MTDITSIVHRYIDTWNETDAERRRGLIAEVFTPDASYTDPLVAARGREAIDQFVAHRSPSRRL